MGAAIGEDGGRVRPFGERILGSATGGSLGGDEGPGCPGMG